MDYTRRKEMFKKKWLVIAIIFVAAVVSRTFWLNKEPNGITNDELHFVLNAKAVYYGFTDMSGKWNPLSLTTIPDNPSAEVTFPLLAPFIGPAPINLVTVRIPFAVINSLLVVVLYLIASEISPTVGLIAGILSIINPWNFYMGRIAFDQPIATFFMMLTLWLLIKMKKNWILLAILSAFMAFFTYIGTKTIFLLFVMTAAIWGWLRNNRKDTIMYILVGLAAIFMTGLYVINLAKNPVRVNELLSPYSQTVVAEVETERRQSLPSKFNPIFDNKYTLYFQHFVKKYLNSFSPNLLFNVSDETYLLSFWKHGFLYYLDAIFLIIGGYYLFRKKRDFFYSLGILLLLAPIPEAIRSDNMPAYAFHSCMQYPILILIIAVGVGYVIKVKPKLTVILALGYGLSFLNLMNLYFYRYPVYQPDGFFFSERLLSKYLDLETKNGVKIVVVGVEPSNLFRQYLFYTQQYTRGNFELIKSIYQNDRNNIKFGNILFTNDKSTDLMVKGTTYITQYDYHHWDWPRTLIRQITSGKEMFSIYGSNLCHQYTNPNQWIQMTSKDFNVEGFSTDEFCRKFVSLIN
jgi:uncharacterized membrane protein